jgi:hypothetical protein
LIFLRARGLPALEESTSASPIGFSTVLSWPEGQTYSGILGYGRGISIPDAVENAYKNAEGNLTDLGYVSTPLVLEDSSIYGQALQKAKEGGYDSITATRVNDNTKGTYWILFGVNEEEYTVLAALLNTSVQYSAVRYDALLKDYLESRE